MRVLGVSKAVEPRTREAGSRVLAVCRYNLMEHTPGIEVDPGVKRLLAAGVFMMLSTEWRALQREAQLAAEQIATGVTTLGKANHAQPGLYSQAFFGLSIGLERLGKLIVITNHAIENSGSFPSDNDLRQIGHDLRKILSKCERIGKTVDPERLYAARPTELIHEGIEETLSEFATVSRYYNLNHITGGASNQVDPIAMWWDKVGMPICERHYSAQQQKRDAAKACINTSLLGECSTVLHYLEDGTEVNNVNDFVGHAGATAIVQKYGRVYTLQIVRWLASILFELSHHGAYVKRIEPLLGLHEPFALFGNDDRFLRRRRTWSTYRL